MNNLGGTGKKIGLSLVFILGIVIIGLIVVYFSVTGSKTVSAQLNVETGEVNVNGQAVSEYSELKEGDSIETGTNGLATVILYESIVISLEENTKITLEELIQNHPVVNQESGNTWNKFSKVADVEDYTIKSGTSVASVRGTAFEFEDGKVLVGEGEVAAQIDGENVNLVKGKAFERFNGRVRERNLSPEEKARVEAKIVRSVAQLRILREKELSKHPRVLNMVKKQTGLSDEDIRSKLESADRGEGSDEEIDNVIRELTGSLPVEVKSIEKVAKITKEIRGLNQLRRGL